MCDLYLSCKQKLMKNISSFGKFAHCAIEVYGRSNNQQECNGRDPLCSWHAIGKNGWLLCWLMAMWHLRVWATSKWWIFSPMAQGDRAFSKNKLDWRVIYWNKTLIDFLARKIKVPHVRLRVLGVTWRKEIYKYPTRAFHKPMLLVRNWQEISNGRPKGNRVG